MLILFLFVDILDVLLNVLPMDDPWHLTNLRQMSMYQTEDEYVRFADTLQDAVNSVTWEQPNSYRKLLFSQYIGKGEAALLLTLA